MKKWYRSPISWLLSWLFPLRLPRLELDRMNAHTIRDAEESAYANAWSMVSRKKKEGL